MRASPFGFNNFSRGLNVIDSPYTLQEGEARDVLNMVSSPRGAIKKRPGSTVFASGSVAYFPTLAVADSFIRADEDPLNNAGKWTQIGTSKGRIKTNAWGLKANNTVLSGAFWNVAEQTNPAVSIEFKAGVGGVATMVVLACVDATGTKWYEARSEWRPEPGHNKIFLYKEDGGVRTQLLEAVTSGFGATDKFGITVRGGVVTAWRTTFSPTWEVIGSASDASYTKGFSGFQGNLSLANEAGFLNNFSTGEAAASAGESVFTSILPCSTSGGNFLIAAAGTSLYSISELGEITSIGSGFTAGKRWSIIQSTSGAPNRVVADGPIYLSNGTDPPQYWTGAAKGTAVAEWTSKPEGAFVAVPKAKYLTYLGNRVWASGIATDPSALRFSGFSVKAEEGEQPDPTNWPKENVVWFEKDDGEPITGTGIAGSYLLVFKNHKTWAVYDLNEGENRRLSDSIGCVAYRSIVETSQGTFFLTPDQGVFVTNGSTLRDVSRTVRPILQGTDSNTARAAKRDELQNAAGGFLDGHYYLSYMAQDGSMKTLDYDMVLQSWWLHDLAGNQWVHWEPKAGNSSMYTIPNKVKGGVVKAFVPGVYQDSGVNYTGAKGLSCYWFSSWEPFFQYVLRHRINQPQTKKRIRELFVDGSGELIAMVSRKFGTEIETLKGVVDNADESAPTSPLTLGTSTLGTQAARYYSLGVSRVWSFGFGNNSAEPLEIDAYACDLSFRKS